MKEILFVINTLGHAGAEMAFLELLKRLKESNCVIYLYVLMGQGEMFEQLPSWVEVLNSEVSNLSVLSETGRRRMVKTVLSAFWKNGSHVRKLCYTSKYFIEMVRKRNIRLDKMLWRMIAEGADRFDKRFDLAVAWLEGGSAYYVADHVQAEKKAAFVHIDYEKAGYTKDMDRDCWEEFEYIFAISDEVKKSFLQFYPEYTSKTRVFYNMIDREAICRKSKKEGGFSDDFKGMRLLTVGRLTYQKGYDIAIETMKLLKKDGCRVRWFVLGEGEQRAALEKKIASLGLKEDFVLLGAVDNPYPYYLQADLYVHATRYEGKSISLQEAQILGCPVIASNCNGNREQIIDGRDGILCELSPRVLADAIEALLQEEERRKALGRAAKEKKQSQDQELVLLQELFA